jgi:hypothetical protein
VVDWLVPISRRTRFLDRSGRAISPTLETVRQAGLSGRLTSVVVDVRGALADVEDRDTIWLLWTEHDLGILAVGRAEHRPPRRGERPSFKVTLDRTRTRTLVVDPMPATLVYRWITDLHSGQRLDLRPRALEAVQSWEHDRAERDEVLLRPLGLPSWRSRAAQGGRGRPIDDPLLASIVPFLRSQDFAVGVVLRDRATRLVARRSRDLLVVHAVPGGASRPDRARAVGELREHRWSLQRAHADDRLEVWGWIAFAARPPTDALAFLEDEALVVTWRQSGGRVEMSERSKQRWYQRLGVR